MRQFDQGYKALGACGEAARGGGGKGTKKSSSGGFGAPTTGVAESGGLTGDGVAVAAATTTSSASAGTGGGGASASAAGATTGTVAQSGESAGSVREVDLRTLIGLGVLDLIAAAGLL